MSLKHEPASEPLHISGGATYPRSERGFSGEPVFFSIFESAYEKLIMNFPYLVSGLGVKV